MGVNQPNPQQLSQLQQVMQMAQQQQPQTSAVPGSGVIDPRQQAIQSNLQNSAMNPHVSIAHLLALLDEVVLSPQMNYIDKTKFITPIADALTKLMTANKQEQQSLSPDQQMQIEQAKLQLEQQKSDREHGLKLVELQHKMQLDKQEAEHKAALEAIQATAQTAQQTQESQAKLDQMQQQNELAIRNQNHAEMMAHREQDFAEKLAQDKAEPTAGQEVL